MTNANNETQHGYYVMLDDDTTVAFAETLEEARQRGQELCDAEPLPGVFSIQDMDGNEIEQINKSGTTPPVLAQLVRVSIEGIIEITHETTPSGGFKVSGPADDDRYTVRNIATQGDALNAAQVQAQRKANDAGGLVAVNSYIGCDPLQSVVLPCG